MRCVSGKEMDENKPKKMQINYYETDSSTDGSLTEDEQSESKRTEESNIVFGEKPTENDEIMRKQEEKIIEYIPIVVMEDMQLEMEKKKAKKEAEIYFKALEKIKGKQIPVFRLNNIEEQRSKLPIHAEEQQIVEAINENTVKFVKFFKSFFRLLLYQERQVRAKPRKFLNSFMKRGILQMGI